MTSYADYQDYQEFSGEEAVIPTASRFNKYSLKATQHINRYTFGNIKTPDNTVKMCCCELAEYLYSYDNLIKKGVTSESIGDLSVHYESSETITQLASREIREIIYNWLENTGLLYRGV